MLYVNYLSHCVKLHSETQSVLYADRTTTLRTASKVNARFQYELQMVVDENVTTTLRKANLQ